jgi:hypothetical protein
MAKVVATRELRSVACHACLISSWKKKPDATAVLPPVAAQRIFLRVGLVARIALALFEKGLLADLEGFREHCGQVQGARWRNTWDELNRMGQHGRYCVMDNKETGSAVESKERHIYSWREDTGDRSGCFQVAFAEDDCDAKLIAVRENLR